MSDRFILTLINSIGFIMIGKGYLIVYETSPRLALGVGLMVAGYAVYSYTILNWGKDS